MATTAPTAAPWTVSDDAPSVRFNLSNDKKRTTVTPRDVASLAMWCLLPVTHPLAGELPRWCFVDRLRDVRHAVVVNVDGLTYDDVTRADWAPAGSSPTEAAAEAAVANENTRPNTWLASVRRLGAPVQFAPLWINNTTGRIDGEFFFRQDKNQRLRNAATRAAAAAADPAQQAQQAKTAAASAAGNNGAGRMGKASDILAWAKREVKRVADTASENASPVPPAAENDGNGNGATSPVEEPHPHERLHNALQAERDAAAEARRLRAMSVPEPTLKDWESARPEQLGDLAMTRSELLDHSFILDHAGERGFLPLLPADATEVSPGGPKTAFEGAVAIDCEMVLAAGQVSILARVSVVRVPTGDVLLDEIVQPRLPVVDYVTRYSGITPEMLANSTTSFAAAQAAVRRLVSRETFVLGHGLENDFAALRLIPSDLPRVLDTTLMYPHPNGLPNKNALRFLAHTFLGGRRIQTGVDGHDSIEDATVCIELAGLKLRNGKDFGQPARVNITQLLSVEHKTEPPPSWEPPVISVVERSDALRRVCSRATNAIPARNDGDAAKKTVAALNRSGTGGGAGRGVFVYTRLCEVAPPEEDEEAEVAASGGEHLAAKKNRTEGGETETAAEPAAPPAGSVDDATLDESQPWYRSCKLNARLARIVNAAPVGTLVCVMAALAPTQDSPNRHASAHGCLLSFVKTAATPRASEEAEDYIPKRQSAAASAGCAHA